MSAIEEIEEVAGELVPYENGDLVTLFGTHEPKDVVREASKYAKALAEVISKQKLFTQIGPNRHVRVEGWQLLGSMTGVFAVGEGEPEPVEINGVNGFKATVTAQRNGQVIGRATAYCMRDESRWTGQPTHAVASMAQTRATSKALKGPLGFIVKLAGFESTPAEEMQHVEPQHASAPAEPAQQSVFQPPASVRETGELASSGQVNNINRLRKKIVKAGSASDQQLDAKMVERYASSDPALLTKKQASDCIDRLKALAGEETT